MDVFQKVLLKVYEQTGGKDTEDVDFAELLKREGFYASLPDIIEHLCNQSWIAETSRKNIVRITHWGVAEAKKLTTLPTDAAQTVSKEANRLLSESRELVRILEDFVGDKSKENFTKVETKAAELIEAIAHIKANL